MLIFRGVNLVCSFYRMTCIFIWPFLFATIWSKQTHWSPARRLEGFGLLLKVHQSSYSKTNTFSMFHLERITYERDHEPPFTHPASPFQHDIRHFYYHICSWGIHSTAFGSLDICQIGLGPVRGLSPCELQLKGLFSYQKKRFVCGRIRLVFTISLLFSPEILQLTHLSQRFLSSKTSQKMT